MKALGSVVLALGVISMVIGLVVRLMNRSITALGLEPSSFLEFSIACFLLTLALEAVGKK